MNEQSQPIELIRDLSWKGQPPPIEATTQIQYVSQGHCLIIGDVATALDVGGRYTGSGSGTGFTVVCIDPDQEHIDKQLTQEGVAVFTVPSMQLNGHLGAWQASVTLDSGQSVELAVSVYRESGFFDLVLDLSPEPILNGHLLPFGYMHAKDAAAVDEALQALAELTGEFEKPRYFHYEASLCAHSRSELDGCNRCIEVCAANAIVDDGEGVSVDPFLCQGCGSCASVCPSGAMSYAYPRPADALMRTREMIREQGASVLILHDESAETLMNELSLPESVLPLLVEEVTAYGADYWLTMLAGGVQHICLLFRQDADDPGRRALQSQLDWVMPLLSDLGVSCPPVSLVEGDDLESHVDVLMSTEGEPARIDINEPQYFATHNDKRQTLRLALDALSAQMAPQQACTSLPPQAPFGRIRVNTDACTLCMACVSTCPAKALQDGQDTPALRFIESNCLQCGLCQEACPESAISLEARYQWDSVQARKVQTLHDEAPFHCIRCHVPFTTQRMIDTMSEKLAGHWMFQDPKAMRRLRLCGDCRVRDMFEEDAAGISTHK